VECDRKTKLWRWAPNKLTQEQLEQLEAPFFLLITRNQVDRSTLEFNPSIFKQIKTLMTLEEQTPEQLEDFRTQERERYVGQKKKLYAN